MGYTGECANEQASGPAGRCAGGRVGGRRASGQAGGLAASSDDDHGCLHN